MLQSVVEKFVNLHQVNSYFKMQPLDIVTVDKVSKFNLTGSVVASPRQTSMKTVEVEHHLKHY
jgi:hypothetical protein